MSAAQARSVFLKRKVQRVRDISFANAKEAVEQLFPGLGAHQVRKLALKRLEAGAMTLAASILQDSPAVQTAAATIHSEYRPSAPRRRPASQRWRAASRSASRAASLCAGTSG